MVSDGDVSHDPLPQLDRQQILTISRLGRFVERRTVDRAAEEALGAADLGKIRRARYERSGLVGVGLAVGAALVAVVGLSLERGKHGAEQAKTNAHTNHA